MHHNANKAAAAHCPWRYVEGVLCLRSAVVQPGVGAFGVLQNAPTLFASLLPELHQLMCSKEQELQQLGVQLLGQCAIQLRKRGIVLTSSPDTKTAAHVQQQVLPCLRLFSKGKSPAGSSHGGNTRAEDMQDGGVADDAELDSQLTAALGSLCTPKSAKWAVYGLVCCQDGVTGKRELEQLADELSHGLVSTAPETAARLQALATVGRVYPGDAGTHPGFDRLTDCCKKADWATDEEHLISICQKVLGQNQRQSCQAAAC